MLLRQNICYILKSADFRRHVWQRISPEYLGGWASVGSIAPLCLALLRYSAIKFHILQLIILNQNLQGAKNEKQFFFPIDGNPYLFFLRIFFKLEMMSPCYVCLQGIETFWTPTAKHVSAHIAGTPKDHFLGLQSDAISKALNLPQIFFPFHLQMIQSLSLPSFFSVCPGQHGKST